MNECKLVHDLWPLYLDNELSAESAQFVTEHLRTCPDCQKLPAEPSEKALNWEAVEPPANSLEKFMLRWQRRRIRIIAFVIVMVLLIAWGALYYGQWSGQQASQKQLQVQKDLFNKQMTALQNVSPPAEQLLRRWGITFAIDHIAENAGRISLNYSLHWNSDSPVDQIGLDTNRYWFDQNLLINADSGAALPLSNAGGGGGSNGFTGQLLTQPLTQPVAKLVFKTYTLYAWLKGPETGFDFDYSGGRQTIALNRQFSFQGIDFMIDSLQLNDSDFTVRYHQLTPATQAGVFQLSFTFDDRLGNAWSANLDSEQTVSDPDKEISIPAPHSPAKHWLLKVDHIIQVIPGIKSNLDLNGGSRNDQ